MIGAELRGRLEPVIELLATEPASITSVRDPERAWRVHVEDSLSGLDLLGHPDTLADLGSGAGFPGLVLAAALPETSVDLIESVGRKCEFIARAIDAARLPNARAVNTRAEIWAATAPPEGGRHAYDVVAARAVGRLSTLAELAAPLLREGGALVAWKGRRDAAEEEALAAAGGRLAMRLEAVRPVAPRPQARNRHLHLIRKTAPTPEGLPRRPGMAKKRPFGERPVHRRGPG